MVLLAYKHSSPLRLANHRSLAYFINMRMSVESEEVRGFAPHRISVLEGAFEVTFCQGSQTPESGDALHLLANSLNRESPILTADCGAPTFDSSAS